MACVVAGAAQPNKIVGGVAASVRTERDVVCFGAGTDLADVAGFVLMLEPEPAERILVFDAFGGTRVSCQSLSRSSGMLSARPVVSRS